jgi:hypothetical protein
VLLLFLIYIKVIPAGLNTYALAFAISLLTARLFVRIIYNRQNKINNTGG